MFRQFPVRLLFSRLRVSMYRILNAQKINIYCDLEMCDMDCGLFHRPEVKRRIMESSRKRRGGRHLIRDVVMITFSDKQQHRVQSSDIEKISLERKADDSSDNQPKPEYLEITHTVEPITPITAATFSGASTVTLDEIIASAKRKISQEYIDLRIPSPVFIDNGDSEMHNLAKQRQLIGGTAWPEDVHNPDGSGDHRDDASFVDHLINSSDDDDELWVDPPFSSKYSLVVILTKIPCLVGEDDEEQQDLGELLKYVFRFGLTPYSII